MTERARGSSASQTWELGRKEGRKEGIRSSPRRVESVWPREQAYLGPSKADRLPVDDGMFPEAHLGVGFVVCSSVNGGEKVKSTSVERELVEVDLFEGDRTDQSEVLSPPNAGLMIRCLWRSMSRVEVERSQREGAEDIHRKKPSLT